MYLGELISARLFLCLLGLSLQTSSHCSSSSPCIPGFCSWSVHAADSRCFLWVVPRWCGPCAGLTSPSLSASAVFTTLMRVNTSFRLLCPKPMASQTSSPFTRYFHLVTLFQICAMIHLDKALFSLLLSLGRPAAVHCWISSSISDRLPRFHPRCSPKPQSILSLLSWECL